LRLPAVLRQEGNQVVFKVVFSHVVAHNVSFIRLYEHFV
jgi:hypothetical protein